MKLAFWQHLAVLTALGLSSVPTPTWAAQFDQQEIDQGRFIVLAAPGGEIGYKLLILEQLNDKRPCWSETGSNPSTVDPLLLNFDFTGICNRLVDSNSFSVRTAGQDQALQYSLRVVQKDGDLVLVAASNNDRNTQVEIGRTHGLPNGFSRIILDPGWRLTRRTFNGRPLGHVYLTFDQPMEVLVASARRNVPIGQQTPPLYVPSTSSPTLPSSDPSSVIPVPSLPPAATTPAPTPPEIPTTPAPTTPTPLPPLSTAPGSTPPEVPITPAPLPPLSTAPSPAEVPTTPAPTTPAPTTPTPLPPLSTAPSPADVPTTPAPTTSAPRTPAPLPPLSAAPRSQAGAPNLSTLLPRPTAPSTAGTADNAAPTVPSAAPETDEPDDPAASAANTPDSTPDATSPRPSSSPTVTRRPPIGVPQASNSGGALLRPRSLRENPAPSQPEPSANRPPENSASSSSADSETTNAPSQPGPSANRPPENSASSSSADSETTNAPTMTAQAETYQVIVVADSAETQDKVKAIAPDAFLTTINGQVVMQVGVFQNRQEADQLQQRLSLEGLPTAVISVR